MTGYDAIARYYDLAHDLLTDDIPFVVELAKSTGGRVLELGCGSGRLLLPLARAGLAVTGVDSSAAMLRLAEQRIAAEEPAAAARIRLVEGDMTSITLDDPPFDLALFGYNTFMHLSETEAIAALRRARACLRPGGTLLVDLENPFVLSAEGGEPRLEAEFGSDDRPIRQYAAYVDVPGEQAVDVTWTYEETLADGTTTRAESRFRQHIYYPHQLDLLLSQTGFRLTGLGGGYAGESYDEEAERLLALGVAV